ncbi:MAG TPA: LuxR C-terminal-related transcriptional regulator [Burkholderiales bacterium]|nr:LuxR C-terminal-related transcriptional regulator [Burkholderiales bacterium]
MRTAAASLVDDPLAIPQSLCPLIDAVGTPEFRRQLFASVERMVGAGATAVYWAGLAEVEPLLGDWALGASALARHTSEYARRYASQDPAYRAFGALRLRSGARTCLTTCVVREELPDPGHRRLMVEAGFVDRIVTLFPARGRGWFSLHILRGPEHGAVSDLALERFAQAAPVFGSLIARHQRASEALESRLAAGCPGLTPREASVCAGLLRGHSSAHIAAALGIGIASVHTYRKRAYRKLGVSKLAELFVQLLSPGDSRWTSAATRNATTPD